MDIRAYLRDMDREEEELRREIMHRQVRIQQLHDARLLLMGREEERARKLGQPSPFGALPGEIVVRDPEARFEGSMPLKLPAAAKSEPALGGKVALSTLILRALAASDAPMSVGDLADAIPERPRKRVHGAASNLKQRGLVVWDAQHRYSLTGKGRKEVGKTRMERASRSDAGKARPKRSPFAGKAMREQVAEIVAKKGPLAAGEIVTELFGEGPYDKPSRDRVYSALHHIRNYPGQVVFDGEKYRLRRQEAAE